MSSLSVGIWLPRLEGKSNWAEWRRNIEEAIHEVEEKPVYWDIIMDRPLGGLEGYETPPHIKISPSSPSSHRSLTNPDVAILGSTEVRNREVLNIRAREILDSSLGVEPKKAVSRISDAREAYLKLESLYGGTSAQSIYVVWEKWVKIRYASKNNPKTFVEKFKNALQDVRDQSVDVTATVVLAQFQQAIKSHPDTTTFMADMKVDIYDPELMQKVYEEFEKSQIALPGPGSMFASFLESSLVTGG